MHITLIIIAVYITSCIRVGTGPWKFFQLNVRYFSKDLGFFSKLRIDDLIPDRWRLHQVPDDGTMVPERFPVFMKPEWGQNAAGIYKADNFEELQNIRKKLREEASDQQYIMQEAAPGAREFEIFSIDVKKSDGRHDIVTVTEAVNDVETLPVNSKNNGNTRYVEVTSDFSEDEKVTLSRHLDTIGEFAITRMSVRADNYEDLLAGRFHVIEVNLFVPMPINLLDEKHTLLSRFKFIRSTMMLLALATKEHVPMDDKWPPAIFWRMCFYGRGRTKSAAPTHNLNKMAARRTLL